MVYDIDIVLKHIIWDEGADTHQFVCCFIMIYPFVGRFVNPA